MQTGPGWMPARAGSAGGDAMADQSVPLSEALERFSEPGDWKELRSLERYDIQFFILGAPETEEDRLCWRFHRLKERLESEFVAKLTAGSLQASGLVWPIGLNAKRQTIPAARWHKLEPDFAASEATGGGLRVVDIRIQEAQQARTRSSHPSPTSERMPREHASLARLRTELRRWLQREAHEPRDELAKEALLQRRTNQVWRPGDQQPLQ